MTTTVEPVSAEMFAELWRIGLRADDMGRDRSLQSQQGLTGVSDIGLCRERTRLNIIGADRTDPDDSSAATIGTYIHSGALVAFQRSFPHVLIEADLTVTLPSGAVIPGHADIIDPEEPSATDLKGLALDTRLVTPTGWTTMGEVQVGDWLLDKDGQPCQVWGKSEVKHLPCYEVTFGNGQQIVCDEEHLWLARTQGGTGRARVIPVKEIGTKFGVPVAGELHLPGAALPIEPWLLGYWLGNGARTGGSVSCHSADAHEVQLAAKYAGYDVGEIRLDPRSLGATMYVKGLGPDLRAAGVAPEKRVPDAYLRSAPEQRRALLRGLLDSDGSWNRQRQRAIFSSCDKHLAVAVRELAASLGLKPQYEETWHTGYGKTVLTYSIEFTARGFNPFSVARKAAEVKVRSGAGDKSAWHHATVRPVVSVPTQCVGVSSPSRTYLVGDWMIPTHNTVDGIEYVRRHGPTEQQRIQRTLYALGAHQAGLFGDIPIEQVIVRNVWVDRSGGTDEVVVEQEPFDWQWIERAEEWLSDVRYAVDHGEEASKDAPIPFCQSCCPFFTACRGSDIPPPVITDPELILAARTYREALDEQNRAEKLKKEAAKRLDGVEGQCGDLHVKHVYVAGSHVEFDRAASTRIDVKPIKTKGQS